MWSCLMVGDQSAPTPLPESPRIPRQEMPPCGRPPTRVVAHPSAVHLRPTLPRTLHRSGNSAAQLLLTARRLARRLAQHVTLLRVDTGQGSGLTGQRRSAHGTALPGFALGKGTRCGGAARRVPAQRGCGSRCATCGARRVPTRARCEAAPHQQSAEQTPRHQRALAARSRSELTQLAASGWRPRSRDLAPPEGKRRPTRYRYHNRQGTSASGARAPCHHLPRNRRGSDCYSVARRQVRRAGPPSQNLGALLTRQHALGRSRRLAHRGRGRGGRAHVGLHANWKCTARRSGGGGQCTHRGGHAYGLRRRRTSQGTLVHDWPS